MVRAAHIAPALALLVAACASTRPPSTLEVVQTFREARESGDLDTARALMSEEPRVWYGEREGDGRPWTLGAGRWKAWDEHFNGSSEVVSIESTIEEVSMVLMENNDYYSLTERGSSPVRLTWFVNASGLIEGYLVSSVECECPSTSRYDEFEEWGKENAAAELEYLVPGGSVDPTGDRAPRFRALLERWRLDAGLPPI